MELVISDSDFPLLAGLCGLEKQVEHICKFLGGTLAEGMDSWQVAKKGGFFESPGCFSRPRKYVAFDPRISEYLQILSSDKTHQVKLRIGNNPVTLRTRIPEQTIDKKGRPCNIVFGPRSKATLLQLAVIHRIYPAAGGGVIVSRKQTNRCYTPQQLRKIFKQACKKRALKHAVYFLTLIRICHTWQEIDERVFSDSLNVFRV